MLSVFVIVRNHGKIIINEACISHSHILPESAQKTTKNLHIPQHLHRFLQYIVNNRPPVGQHWPTKNANSGLPVPAIGSAGEPLVAHQMCAIWVPTYHGKQNIMPLVTGEDHLCVF